MVNPEKLRELEQRLRAQLRTEDIGELHIHVFGARPSEFEQKPLPYGSYSEFIAAIRTGSLQMKVAPQAAYIIQEKVATAKARLLASVLAICSFFAPVAGVLLAFAAHDWACR